MRVGGGNVVAHAALGQHQIARGRSLLDKVDHRLGATGKVRSGHHFRAALRVRDYHYIRELGAYRLNVAHGELLMHLTATMPAHHLEVGGGGQLDIRLHRAVDATIQMPCQRRRTRRDDDLLAGFAGDILRQVLVGQEDNTVAAERLDHLNGIAGGDADVGFGLDISIGVDIGDNRHARVLGAQPAHIFGSDGLGQRTTGVGGRQQNSLVGVENLGRFRHKFHATKDDNVLVGLGSLAAQHQRIAYIVWNRGKERRFHVVVAQDDGILLDLETVDLIGDFGLDLKFDIRHHIRELLAHLVVHILNRCCLNRHGCLFPS